MKAVKITGDYEMMKVTFDDGRRIEISGEEIPNGFIAYENTISKWAEPEGVPVSESEKQEIMDALFEKAKEYEITITFVTYIEPTESEREANWRAFVESLGKM